MIIWIASYPKSGNTLIRSIISLLLFTKNGLAKDFKYLKAIDQYPTKKYFLSLVKNFNDPLEIQKNWIPSQKLINKDKQIRFFKTHHIFCRYGQNLFTDNLNTLGVIHIVRDPRNILESIKYLWNLKNNKEAKDKLFDIQNMTSLKIDHTKEYSFPVMISSWQNHYNAWKKMKKNYFLIRYEDLINDKKNQIYKIVNYLKRIRTIEISEEKIDNIIKTTSFENFKKFEKDGLFNESNWDNKNNKFKSFFNVGPNKDYSSLNKSKINSEIEKKFFNEMKELNYL